MLLLTSVGVSGKGSHYRECYICHLREPFIIYSKNSPVLPCLVMAGVLSFQYMLMTSFLLVVKGMLMFYAMLFVTLVRYPRQ